MSLKIRSSRPVVSKRNFVKFYKFHGKISAIESFLSKVKPSRLTLRYKGRHHWCFRVNIMQIYFFPALFHTSIPSQILRKVDIIENSRKLTEITCAGNSKLLHRCFPENFANFLRTPFLQNTSARCF